MKVVVLRSVKEDTEQKTDDPYLQEFDALYANRVIGNLVDEEGFCTSCSADCIFCRQPYNRKFEKDIAAVIDFPAVLPYVLENPAQYVPRELPQHDILLAINIHEQVLVEILKRCRPWGTRGVVVPLEEPHWATGAGRAQATAVCEANGIEIAFPKPFCGFQPPPGSLLEEFTRYFGIGAPQVELTVKDGVIVDADVKVSAACGATYYIARWLVGKRVEDDLAIEVISKRLHSYPCTASMERDPELDDDTALHISGQAHNQMLSSIKEVKAEKEERVRSPLGIMVQKAVPITENRRNIENAKQLVLRELQDQPMVKLERLRQSEEVSPAALHSALLLLKKEGRIRTEARNGSLETVWKTEAAK